MGARRGSKTPVHGAPRACLPGRFLLGIVIALGAAPHASGGTPGDPQTPAAAAAREGSPGLSRDAASAVLLVRHSPIAGFQFHAGEAIWTELRVGEPLALVREPANPHDANAVRVDWRGLALGYVPRRDNRQVARQLDRGVALEARVSRLRESRNPWDRVEFEVVMPLPATAADQSAVSSP